MVKNKPGSFERFSKINSVSFPSCVTRRDVTTRNGVQWWNLARHNCTYNAMAISFVYDRFAMFGEHSSPRTVTCARPRRCCWWCPLTSCWRPAVAAAVAHAGCWFPSCGRCTCCRTTRWPSQRCHLLYESVSFRKPLAFRYRSKIVLRRRWSDNEKKKKL